jgi:hypothetical protein
MNIQRAIDRLAFLIDAETMLKRELEKAYLLATDREKVLLTLGMISNCQSRIDQLNLVLKDLQE